MKWTPKYLELLEEYARLCNVAREDMKRHIQRDELGLLQFLTWADCLPCE